MSGARRHKIKVVVVSGYGMPVPHTYVNCALIDTAVNEVWKRYQAKTPLGEGQEPTWKKSLVFGGMPKELAFALRFDIFDAEKKELIGRVQISKESTLEAIAGYKEVDGTPNESWSSWYAMEAVNESGAKRGPAKGGGLHIALVPPSVKTADANLSPPVPAPAAKAQSSNSPSSSSSKPSCTANPTPEVKRGSSSKKKDDKPWTEERLAKAKRKRIHARQEIIDSEESYLNNLTALMDTYVTPMKQVVDPADHKKMFSDVKSICDFHGIFYPFVKKSSDIGYCFLKYADYLKIYTEFINHYAGVIECLSENRKNKKFTHFLKEARTNAKMEITGYLIQPVQRIPRYVLLLKELQRYTWPEHHEHDNLVKALAKAEEIATHVNERKRQIENMTKTLEVQSNITGTFDSLIKPDRKMIREDVLIKVSSGMFSSMKRKERVMFLFSDLLLWTTTAYQFRGKMSLAAAHAEVSKKIDLGLEISSSKELCLLVFESKAQMESWIADFKAGKEYAKKVRKRLMEVRKRTIDSKRGKAHTLVMEAFKTLEKDRSSAGSNENLENLSTHASETGSGE